MFLVITIINNSTTNNLINISCLTSNYTYRNRNAVLKGKFLSFININKLLSMIDILGSHHQYMRVLEFHGLLQCSDFDYVFMWKALHSQMEYINHKLNILISTEFIKMLKTMDYILKASLGIRVHQSSVKENEKLYQ